MKRFELFTEMKLYVEPISLNGIEDDREGREELEDDPNEWSGVTCSKSGKSCKKFLELLAKESR
jgi:hypothetical protein